MTWEGGHEHPDSDGRPIGGTSHIGRLYRRLGRIGVRPGIGTGEASVPRGPGPVKAPQQHEAIGGNYEAAPLPGAVGTRLQGYPGQLERLSPAGFNALVVAREQARILRHRTVGTEHLLLALTLDAQSGAYRVMHRMGANPDMIRADTLRALAPGAASTSDLLPFTPRARLAVELAHRASERIGVARTGTEHLLIGLAAESEGIAAKALHKSGIVARTAENQVTADLDGRTPGRE